MKGLLSKMKTAEVGMGESSSHRKLESVRSVGSIPRSPRKNQVSCSFPRKNCYQRQQMKSPDEFVWIYVPSLYSS